MKARSPLCLLAIVLITSLASSVFAQTVIKQTKTTTFPINISKLGSYVLESNITAPSTYTGDIIGISASYVSLDLNGFNIGGGSQSGNNAAIHGGSNVIVRNGTVNAGSAYGILLGELSRIERVRVSTAYTGVGDDSQVLDSNFYYLIGGNNSLFSGNVAIGIQGYSGTLATHNVTWGGGGISGVTSLGDNLCNGIKC
jgi:hypothetical protein